MASILNNAYAIILVAVGLGFVVFIHELGHFVMAKWAGVKVEMFSLGFGPTLVSWRKGFGFRLGSSVKDYNAKLVAAEEPQCSGDGAPHHESKGVGAQGVPMVTTAARAARVAVEEVHAKYGETEYQIRALPLGGFVLMLGEEGDDESGKTTDPRAFGNKPVGARMAIISAGVIMNVIFGVLCATWVYAKGKPERPAIIGFVVAGQPAYEAGIRAGDEVVGIDGRGGDLSYDDLAQASQFSGTGQILKLDLKRPGQDDLIHVAVEPKRVGKAPAPSIGVYVAQSLDLVGKVPAGLVSDDDTFDRVLAAGPETGKPGSRWPTLGGFTPSSSAIAIALSRLPSNAARSAKTASVERQKPRASRSSSLLGASSTSA